MPCVSLLLSNDVGSEQVISYQRRQEYNIGNDDSKNMYGFKQLRENTNSQTITLEQWKGPIIWI